MVPKIVLIGIFTVLSLEFGAAVVKAFPSHQNQARISSMAKTEITRTSQPGLRTPPPSAQVSLSHGTYSNNSVRLRLTLDVFELTDTDRGLSTEGDFEIVDGILSLTNPTAPLASIEFPVICRVERFGPGIRLRDETGQCAAYHDMLLREER